MSNFDLIQVIHVKNCIFRLPISFFFFLDTKIECFMILSAVSVACFIVSWGLNKCALRMHIRCKHFYMSFKKCIFTCCLQIWGMFAVFRMNIKWLHCSHYSSVSSLRTSIIIIILLLWENITSYLKKSIDLRVSIKCSSFCKI